MGEIDQEDRRAEQEAAGAAHPAPPAGASHDEDDRLAPGFVHAVVERVEAGDTEGARALVDPLHPADIAELFALAPAEARQPLAAALAERLDGEVLAEMNDWVRDGLIEQLDANQVAELAGQLDTDDAVAIIEDMEDERAAPCSAPSIPTTAPPSRRRSPSPRNPRAA